jgi:outer membrane protein assembly factor BamB
VALDKKTGRTVWVNASIDETAAYCSPILVTHPEPAGADEAGGGVRQLITLTQRSVIGVEVAGGKLLWSHPHVTPHDQNVNAPVYSDGYVFVASGHSGGGRVVKIAADSRHAEEVWWDKSLDNCHGGVMLLGGHLYGSACRSGGKGFFCAELRTGRVRWREPLREKLSLTAADGMIYALTQRGEVLLIEPRTDRFEVRSRFRLPRDSRELAWAHPVVCGGRLYLRQGPFLYAYDVRAPGR